MATTGGLAASLTLRKGVGVRVGGARISLLEAVRDLGSITLAAKAVGLSYKSAWGAVQAINNLFDRPLVVARVGGRSGGAATVTAEGRAVIEVFHAVEAELARALERLERSLGDPGPSPLSSLFWSLGMKTSARNALRGAITQVSHGAVNSEVALEVAPGVEIVAIITRASVAELGLAPGRPAIALIKSSSIILASGEAAPRTSARNQLAGVVSSVEDGAVNSEVTLALDAGKTLTATITLQSRREMGLEPGDPAVGLIKASSVILALE